jgi:hypothetical protein
MGDYSSGTDGSAGYRYMMGKFDAVMDEVKSFVDYYPEMRERVLKEVEEFVNDYYKEKDNGI